MNVQCPHMKKKVCFDYKYYISNAQHDCDKSHRDYMQNDILKSHRDYHALRN